MKKVYYTLLQSKGIGPSLAKDICTYLGISPNSTYNSLSPEKLEGLGQVMGFLKRLTVKSPLPTSNTEVGLKTMFGPIDSLLIQFNKKNILKLVELNTYRGRRHKLGYPVRGQRTRSNGRTASRLNRSFSF
jgi:small subunit ribosomal protein S13|tara:strand:+ start:165 stop:557 length:393 start_codon:yes stop_codon:yes gene_type:complete